MISTPCYSHRMDEALALVTEAFRNKRRKSTEIPYLSHLLQVAVWVAERGGSEEQIIAALLHDYLEDIEGSSAEELEAGFGP
ncbi:MAG: HD domain-containing protein, partial [Myxococcota bacterium]|nr:HD domain-containing protein [Myxococcota bacterium]